MKSRRLATSKDLANIPRIAPIPRVERSKFDKLMNLSDDLVRMAERNLEDFKKKLNENPAHAFEWSSNAFQYAADLQVGRMIQRNLSDFAVDKEGSEVTQEDRVEYILREALRISLNQARASLSTSVQSNEMSRCIASTWAKVYQRVELGGF